MSIISDCSLPVYISLGSYGGMSTEHAVYKATSTPPSEPFLGRLSSAKLQICPQNAGHVNSKLCTYLREQYPNIEWRLHAGVRAQSLFRVIHLADYPNELEWFREVAKLSSKLRAPVYSAHAGYREHTSLKQLFDRVRAAEQMFGIPVAVEGHYPTPCRRWLIDTWEEYRAMLYSGVHYALDMSHINILVEQSGRLEWHLLEELLDSPQCVEIHISDNDGSSDQHHVIRNQPWWWDWLLERRNQSTPIFSEGRR